MRYTLFFLFLVGSLCNSFSQENLSIDSLYQQLDLAQNDSIKTEVLSDLFDQFLYANADSAGLVLNDLKQLAVNTSKRYPKVKLYMMKGTLYLRQRQMDSAAYFYQLSLTEAGGAYDDQRLENLTRLASISIQKGDFSRAEEQLLDAMPLADSIQNFDQLVQIKRMLANVNSNDTDKAQKQYIELVDLMESNPEANQKLLANVYMNFGEFYFNIQEFGKSKVYFNKCAALCQKLKFNFGVYVSRVKLGYILFKEGKLDSALVVDADALAFFREKNIPVKQAEALLNMALVYDEKGDLDQAEVYLLESYKVSEEINYELGMINASVELADVYLAREKPKQALIYSEQTHELSQRRDNAINKKNAYLRLAKSHAMLGNYREAYQYNLSYEALRDSIKSIERAKSLDELETKYQTEKKEQEIKLLTAQNDLANQRSKSQLYIFTGIATVILLVAMLLFVLYRSRRKTAIKLQELDKIRSNFFANISHEFRTPLTLIKSPVEAKLNNGVLQPEERSQYESINRSADRLLSLVDQLLDLSKLEAGSMQLNVEAASLGSLLEASLSSFEYIAAQKNINYQRDFNCEQAEQWFDKDAVEKITVNLVSNAFKYTPDNGEVSCSLHCLGNKAKITVGNTGENINSEELTKLFERFYQADSSKDGVGIGLALVKELTSLHHGRIDFKSENGQTEFTVEIPISESAYTKEEFRTIPVIQKTEYTAHQEAETVDIEDPTILSDNPIMLVVEDNSEVRKLVADLFKDAYSIIEADNGEAGIAKAIQYVPDVIISDVMMPKKDGIELAASLKVDERTSHIPIILLTAKAGEENVITGLETGADDYLIKPFNNEVLKVRVKKLTELREQLRQRYSQEVVLRPKDIAISSADEQFLERVQVLMDEKLVNPDFNAELFSKEIGMSRMQLHRKLKALVGLTTTEFIRSQRLKLAAHLLESSDINMSEVGYSVGFNDPSYFAKCFKEAYGCTPKQYSAASKAAK